MSKPVTAAATAAAVAVAATVANGSHTRWDHLWMDARKAAVENGGADNEDAYATLFQAHVLRFLSGPTRGERGLLEVDARLDCVMHDMGRAEEAATARRVGGPDHLLYDLYIYLNHDSFTDDCLELSDLVRPDTRNLILHKLRRVRAFCPAGWEALQQWVATGAQSYAGADMQLGIEDDDTTKRAAHFRAFMDEADASALGADRTPPPAAVARTKRKLEQLTACITTMVYADAVAELRSILCEAEQSLPAGERTAKKARK